MEPEEITNVEIYRPKFILKWHVFVLHMTSVNTGSVQVTHRAVGGRTMHSFGTDLVRNPAIWLVEIRSTNLHIVVEYVTASHGWPLA